MRVTESKIDGKEWVFAELESVADAVRLARESDAKNAQGSRFSGGSREDALKWATEGWTKGRKQVMFFRDVLAPVVMGNVAESEVRYDVTGDELDVGAYLAGEPECFVSEWETEAASDARSGGVLRFHVDIAASASTTTGQMARRGAAAAALVEVLERVGYAVEVVAHFCSKGHVNQDIHLTVKHSDEKLDIDRVAFWLACPAAFRQLILGGVQLGGTDAGTLKVTPYTPPTNQPRTDGLHMKTRPSSDGMAEFNTDESTAAEIIRLLTEFGIKLEG